eukprot:CFRG3654T1
MKGMSNAKYDRPGCLSDDSFNVVQAREQLSGRGQRLDCDFDRSFTQHKYGDPSQVVSRRQLLDVPVQVHGLSVHSAIATPAIQRMNSIEHRANVGPLHLCGPPIVDNISNVSNIAVTMNSPLSGVSTSYSCAQHLSARGGFTPRYKALIRTESMPTSTFVVSKIYRDRLGKIITSAWNDQNVLLGMHPRTYSGSKSDYVWACHAKEWCSSCVSLACLILANKFIQDSAYSNKSWSVWSDVALAEINNLELAVIKCIGFDLYIQKEEFDVAAVKYLESVNPPQETLTQYTNMGTSSAVRARGENSQQSHVEGTSTRFLSPAPQRSESYHVLNDGLGFGGGGVGTVGATTDMSNAQYMLMPQQQMQHQNTHQHAQQVHTPKRRSSHTTPNLSQVGRQGAITKILTPYNTLSTRNTAMGGDIGHRTGSGPLSRSLHTRGHSISAINMTTLSVNNSEQRWPSPMATTSRNFQGNPLCRQSSTGSGTNFPATQNVSISCLLDDNSTHFLQQLNIEPNTASMMPRDSKMQMQGDQYLLMVQQQQDVLINQQKAQLTTQQHTQQPCQQQMLTQAYTQDQRRQQIHQRQNMQAQHNQNLRQIQLYDLDPQHNHHQITSQGSQLEYQQHMKSDPLRDIRVRNMMEVDETMFEQLKINGRRRSMSYGKNSTLFKQATNRMHYSSEALPQLPQNMGNRFGANLDPQQHFHQPIQGQGIEGESRIHPSVRRNSLEPMMQYQQCQAHQHEQHQQQSRQGDR